jgi:hypothetical protein
MTTVTKSTPIGSLGLEPGEHLVRIHVGSDTVSFAVETAARPATPAPLRPTGFLQRWSGTASKVEDPADEWLTHINDKHLR